MEAILTLPVLPALQHQIGDLVENFGAIVRVESFDSIRGMLVRIIAGGGKGQRYYADPAKCRPVR